MMIAEGFLVGVLLGFTVAVVAIGLWAALERTYGGDGRCRHD